MSQQQDNLDATNEEASVNNTVPINIASPILAAQQDAKVGDTVMLTMPTYGVATLYSSTMIVFEAGTIAKITEDHGGYFTCQEVVDGEPAQGYLQVGNGFVITERG